MVRVFFIHLIISDLVLNSNEDLNIFFSFLSTTYRIGDRTHKSMLITNELYLLIQRRSKDLHLGNMRFYFVWIKILEVGWSWWKMSKGMGHLIWRLN